MKRRPPARNVRIAIGFLVLVVGVPVAFGLLGDVNTDTFINATDSQHVLEAVVGTRLLAPSQSADADVDGDGDVDVFDAQLIDQFVAGAIAEFPPRLPQSSGPIAVTRDGTLVGVVNPDSDTVTFVDAASETVLLEVGVGREPVGIAFTRDGGRALVTNARDASVSVVDTETFVVTNEIGVGVEPFGVVVNFRGDRAYVSNLASATVSVIDVASEIVIGTVPVAPKPQGLATTQLSDKVVVTHLNGGAVSLINAATLAVSGVPISQIPFDQNNLTQPAGKPNRMKGVAIHPTNGQAWLPHILSNSGNFVEALFNTSLFPAISVINTATQSELPANRMTLFSGLTTVVSSPEAVAFAPNGTLAYVVSAASNDLTIINAATRQEVGLLRDVGDNPRGIVVSPDGQTAYVFNRLTPEITVVDLNTETVRRRVAVSSDPLPANIANGRRLFFTSAPPEVAQDRFFGCEGCHFDGRDDGQTWFFTNGPRQSMSLAGGTLETGLLHHNADRIDIQDFRFTFTRLQNGTGLTEDQLDDLADFVNFGLRFLENPFLNADLSRTAAARRGRRVFQQANCAGCHAGPFLTDATGHTDPAAPVLHDVGIFAPGTGTQDATDKTRDQDGIAAGVVRPAGSFESTFLLGVWATAPYLHDGRAATLLDTLATQNPSDAHGVTSTLSAAERNDLVAYLQQLDITNSRVQITSPADNARVVNLTSVSGRVLPDVTAVSVLINGAGPIVATVSNGTFTAAVPPALVPAVSTGTRFDLTALATTSDGEPGRDDVEVEANFGAAAVPATSTVDASPALITANGVDTSIVTVTPRAAGGGLAGTGLTIQIQTTQGSLGLVTDVGDGTYRATLTASTTATVATITAKQQGGSNFTDTAQVRFAAGGVDAAASSVTVQPATLEANGISTAVVTVIPRDAFGNDLAPGQNVMVSVNTGSVGAALDQGDGTYNAVYTAATAVGTATFNVTVNTVALSQHPTVMLITDTTPPAPADLGKVSFSTPVGGITTITGGAGAIEGLATVTATNTQVPAASGMATAGASGSFTRTLAVGPNQEVCFIVRDLAGNQSPQVCKVPFPVTVFSISGIVRRALASGAFAPVAGALVELDVADLTDPCNVGFTPVFAGGMFLTATTGTDGSFTITLPSGFVPDPDLAVVTGPDANHNGLVDTPENFALVNQVDRTVVVDEISTTIPFLICFNDQLLCEDPPDCTEPGLFPPDNFCPDERTVIEETIRAATLGLNFAAPADPLQVIGDDVFFDQDGSKTAADQVAFDTFQTAAESPGTCGNLVRIEGTLTVPSATGPRPLSGVLVELATLSLDPLLVAPIAGSSGVTDASGHYSLRLPGFVTPGATLVVIAVGDLTYNSSGIPGAFNPAINKFSVGGFVTNTTAAADVDIAGRVVMSLLGIPDVPIENFNPAEVDQLLALVRTKLAATPLVLANKTLEQVFLAAFAAMTGDGQVIALVNAIADPETDMCRVTATPLSLEANGFSLVTVTVEPLDQTFQRVGPGRLVELSTSLGTITSPAIDNRDGTYTAFLHAPTTPGAAAVSPRFEGAPCSPVPAEMHPTINFTTDVTTPPAPVGPRLFLTAVGSGAATLIGLPGAVEAGSQVRVTNTRTGAVVIVIAANDGSFRADLGALNGDNLEVRSADAAGHVSTSTGVTVGAGTSLPALGNPTAVPGGVSATLGGLTPAGLGAAIPAGFTFLAGFTLDLQGQTATAPLDVLVQSTVPVAANSDVVLVQAITVLGGTELRVIAAARSAGGVLFPQTGPRFLGVRTGGRYAYLSSTNPLAYLFGTVTGSRGAIQDVHLSTNVSPFTDLSRSDGRYLLVGPVGSQATVTTSLMQHVAGVAAGPIRMPFAGAEVACNATLSTRANRSFAFTGRFAGVGQIGRRLALLPSGDRVYVMLNSRGDLVILDPTTMQQVSLVDDFQSSVDLALAPNGFEAFIGYVSRVRDFTVAIEEPGILINNVGFPRDVAMTPDSDFALIASSLDNIETDATADAVFVIDTFSNTVQTPAIPVPADPAAIAVNRAGTRAYVVSRTQGTLTIIDLATRSVLRTVILGGTLVDVAVTPDGTRLAVASANANTVRVLDAALAEDAIAGNETLAVIGVGTAPSALAITPDGQTLLVAEQQDDTVSVINLATFGLSQVWATVDVPADVEIQPTGKTAYVLDSLTRRGVLEIPVTAMDTTRPVVLDAGPLDRRGQLLQDSPVEVTFNEAMDPATFTGANIQVLDSSDTPIPGTLTPTGDGVAVLFAPAAGVRYQLNSSVKVNLGTGLTDRAGNALAAAVQRIVPTITMQLPNLTLISVDLTPAGVKVTGAAGAVHPLSSVEVENLTSNSVFRTTAAANGSFQLTVVGLDNDGYELTTLLFGGRAKTNPVPLPVNFTIVIPNPSLISYQPGPAGTLQAVGAPGAVDPQSSRIRIRNVTTNQNFDTTTVNPDGSFSVGIFAKTGDSLQVISTILGAITLDPVALPSPNLVPPVIDFISPDRFIFGDPVALTIVGTEFGTVPVNILLKVGGVTRTDFTLDTVDGSPSQQAIIVSLAVGADSGQVIVTVAGQTSNAISFFGQMPANTSPFAEQVIDSSIPGNPAFALGASDATFANLGAGGSLTLRLGSTVREGAGSDFQVFEDTSDGVDCYQVLVSASALGPFDSLGTFCGTAFVDLAGHGPIRFLRLVDPNDGGNAAKIGGVFVSRVQPTVTILLDGAPIIPPAPGAGAAASVMVTIPPGDAIACVKEKRSLSASVSPAPQGGGGYGGGCTDSCTWTSSGVGKLTPSGCSAEFDAEDMPGKATINVKVMRSGSCSDAGSQDDDQITIDVVKVSITDEGGTALMTPVTTMSNPDITRVAMESTLKAKVEGTSSNAMFEWTPPGNVIKTYTHDVDDAAGHKPMPHQSADLMTDEIKFFWTDEGMGQSWKVTATIGSKKCDETVGFDVENFMDMNREVYRIDSDQKLTPDFNSIVSHENWHAGRDMAQKTSSDGGAPTSSASRPKDWGDFARTPPVTPGNPNFPMLFDGLQFLEWHKAYIDAHKAWRKTFTFEPFIGAASPGGAIARPEYLKKTPGGTGAVPAGLMCTGIPSATQSLFFGYVRLGEFQDLDQLGIDTVHPWHNCGHGAIATATGFGDMNTFASPGSQQDTFWKWHSMIDDARSEWSVDKASVVSPGGVAVTGTASAGLRITIAFDMRVSMNAPSRNTVQLSANKLTVQVGATTRTASSVVDAMVSTNPFRVFEFTVTGVPAGSAMATLAGTGSYNGTTHSFTVAP